MRPATLKVVLLVLLMVACLVGSVASAQAFVAQKDVLVAGLEQADAAPAGQSADARGQAMRGAVPGMVLGGLGALGLAAAFIALVFNFPALRHRLDASYPPPPTQAPPKQKKRLYSWFRPSEPDKTNTEALAELKTLSQQGLITPEEYAAKKAEILKRL